MVGALDAAINPGRVPAHPAPISHGVIAASSPAGETPAGGESGAAGRGPAAPEPVAMTLESGGSLKHPP